MAKPFVSVIIPAYNEASRLPLTLIDVDQYLTEQGHAHEIIVVNDGSIDSTGEVVKRFGTLMKQLKYVSQDANMGKSAAIRIGMLAAKGTWRLAMDADNSISIVELMKMLPAMKRGAADVVVGVRRGKGSVSTGEALINAFGRMMLKIEAHDALAGFKCFRGDAAEKIFGLTKFNRWSGDFEVLALAKKLGYRVEEVGVSRIAPKRGLPLGAYLQIIREVIRMRLHGLLS